MREIQTQTVKERDERKKEEEGGCGRNSDSLQPLLSRHSVTETARCGREGGREGGRKGGREWVEKH